ncbi:MAG: DUF5615 family PIN-like protein [Hyphomicrobiaceae bacterium]|nr:DUF5615 family PIN-like protein [Hyphomicrobiaceae bacterium]
MPAYFTDECVAGLIVRGLRERGCEVVDARDVCASISDERVLALAAATGRIIVTEDWGFGEMTIRQPQPTDGLIIVSLQPLSAGTRERHAVEQIIRLGDAAVGALTNIEPARVRSRPLSGR